MDDKARIDQQHSQLCSWLCDAAYPLWSTAGVDPAGGFHERLAQNGKPLAEPRRSRVNPRQAYCFAMAPSLGWRGDSAGLIKHALDYFVARYQRPDGLFRTLVAADGSPLDDRALLYDQAFALLAFNVAAAGGESRAERERQSLELHALVMKHMKRAGQGFEYRRAAEPAAAVESAHASVRSRARRLRSVFGQLGVETAQRRDRRAGVEQVHRRGDRRAARVLRRGLESRARRARAHRRARASVRMGLAAAAVGWSETRTRARAAALKLIEIGETHGVRNGLATNSLLDDFSAHDAGARLWPQTERLKAAAIAARLTGEARYFSMAVAAADGLMRYLDCPIPGLWYDRIDAQGNIVDEPAPASSFYHLVAAIAEISALARFS